MTTVPATDPNKLKALDAALGVIAKEHGDEAVIDMSKGPMRDIEAIPTGSLPLDIALGIGGIPRGRMIELFGPESSGKTTLCYHVIAEVQRRGEIAAFIDTEHAMDAKYAARCGVDMEKLIVSQPDHGEQALQITDVLVNSGALAIVVIDSVAALTPRAELEGQIGDSSVGALARMMSQAMRKLAAAANNKQCSILFTNQIREKIGVMFGSPETQPGGRALKFAASQRLDIRRIETLKKGTDSYGIRVRVKAVKNKVAPPFQQAEFDIIYGLGIDRPSFLIDFGMEDDIGLVKKSGSFFSYVPTDEKLGQGKANAAEYLREHPEIADTIEAKVRAVRLGDGEVVDEDAAAGDEEAPAETSEVPEAPVAA